LQLAFVSRDSNDWNLASAGNHAKCHCITTNTSCFRKAWTKFQYTSEEVDTGADLLSSTTFSPLWQYTHRQGFLKENVRYPVWTCGDPISLILGTRWPFSLILGTQIGSLKHLKKTWHRANMLTSPVRRVIPALQFYSPRNEVRPRGLSVCSAAAACCRQPAPLSNLRLNQTDTTNALIVAGVKGQLQAVWHCLAPLKNPRLWPFGRYFLQFSASLRSRFWLEYVYAPNSAICMSKITRNKVLPRVTTEKTSVTRSQNRLLTSLYHFTAFFATAVCTRGKPC